VTARRVVIACGISPFEHVPPGFGHLPSGSVSHSGHHRDLGAFAGRRVAVVGGGQSAFESAVLMHEYGAERVDVLVKARRIVWLRGNSVYKRIGPLAPIVYAPTDVGPLWYSRLVTNPDRFRHVPRRAQDPIARRCVRPACSHFVRVRLDGVRVSTGVQIVSADGDGGEVRLSLSDGKVSTVDHVLFATGYRVDMSRYGFLADEVLRAMRLTGGYPVLGPGMESSVPGLHVVGAPAAWSFGPTMRFVSGSWYSGRAVAREIAGAARAPRVGRARRR
jgi:FAD-dependent urate hydroxylase